MVKRGISGKGRGGAPPLPRQRGALRVVQITAMVLAGFLARLSYRSWVEYSSAGSATGIAQVAVLGLMAVVFAGGAVWMGVRTVRGPRPPSLD